jgi:nucleoside phosphorylase
MRGSGGALPTELSTESLVQASKAIYKLHTTDQGASLSPHLVASRPALKRMDAKYRTLGGSSHSAEARRLQGDLQVELTVRRDAPIIWGISTLGASK